MTEMHRRTSTPPGWRFQRGMLTRFPTLEQSRWSTHVAGNQAIIYHERVPNIRSETTWPAFRDTQKEMENWAAWRGNDRCFIVDYVTVMEARHFLFNGKMGFLIDFITCKDDLYIWHREAGLFPNDIDLWVLGMTASPNEIEERRAEFDAMIENSQIKQLGMSGLEWGQLFELKLQKDEALVFDS